MNKIKKQMFFNLKNNLKILSCINEKYMNINRFPAYKLNN